MGICAGVALIYSVFAISGQNEDNENHRLISFISIENPLVDPQLYDTNRMLWGTNHRMFPMVFCETDQDFRCVKSDGSFTKVAWPRNLDFGVNSEWEYEGYTYVAQPIELALDCNIEPGVTFTKIIHTIKYGRRFHIISSSHHIVMFGTEYLPKDTLEGPRIMERRKEIKRILENKDNQNLFPQTITNLQDELEKDHNLGFRSVYISSTGCGLFVP